MIKLIIYLVKYKKYNFISNIIMDMMFLLDKSCLKIDWFLYSNKSLRS